jgi:hypothetical protein
LSIEIDAGVKTGENPYVTENRRICAIDRVVDAGVDMASYFNNNSSVAKGTDIGSFGFRVLWGKDFYF